MINLPLKILLAACVWIAISSSVETVYGQFAPPPPPNGMPPRPFGGLPPGEPTPQAYNLIFVAPPATKELKLHDLITVVVNEKSQVTVNSKYNRQRNATFKSEIKEFVKLGQGSGFPNLLNAAENSPTIDTAQQQRLNNTGQVIDAEGVNYRITAEIVDIMPNGNLVLEARKEIKTNDDKWQYTLTGICRFADVGSNNTVQSENIADLTITKQQNGKVFDSTKRSWGMKIFDFAWPF